MSGAFRLAASGIVPSQNTPFRADGSASLGAVARLAESSIAAGAAGMLVNAVASENRSLSLAEREAVARRFIETVHGRVPVIVAVSASDLEASIVLAKQAERLGADAICWQAPASAGFEELDSSIDRLATTFPGVFMLQDLAFGGPGLDIDVVSRLVERHPAFRAIKIETVPAGPKYSAVLRRFGDLVHVSGGWAVMQMMDALERGVHAFVPTAMDAIYVRIHQLYAGGATEAAQALFEKLLPIVSFSNQHIDVSIRFFKMIRHREGLFETDLCRAPTAPLDAVQARHARKFLDRAIALQDEVRRCP